MKSIKQGFIVPLLLAIIALLVIGGGVYLYTAQKAKAPAAVNSETATSSPTSTNVTFTATPNSGGAPLTVTFSALGMVEKNMKNVLVSFGDKTGGGVTEDSPCPTSRCHFSATHTYKSPGTYTATLNEENGDSANIVGTATITVTGDSQSITVPGMSKYTDTDFGFSFWYPSGWQVTPHKYPPVRNDALTNDTIEIKEPVGAYPRTISITKAYRKDGTLDASGACGSCGLVRYYFDTVKHVWMQSLNNDAGVQWTDTQADVSTNTMGGLHVLPDGSRFGGSVVPLSARNFVLVSGDTGGSDRNFGLPLANTILALDPSVATPVSAAQQTATIQAEKDAYAGQ